MSTLGQRLQPVEPTARRDSTPPVLVVEDETVVASALVSMLERLDYPVSGIAATGEEAIERARDQRPGLVLMDVHLRGKLDGIAAAQRIQDEFLIPVVYLTGDSNDDTLARARATRPFGYVLKPFEPRELDVAIQVALYRHRIEHALRASEKRMEAILGSIGDAVIATDADKRITFLNDAAEKLFGWTSMGATGRALTEIVKGDVESDGTFRLQCRGNIVRVELVESPVADDSGATTGFVIVVRDLTERLAAQWAHDRELIQRAARAAVEKEHSRARLKNEISLMLADITQSGDLTAPLRRVIELLASTISNWCTLLIDDGTEIVRLTAHGDPDKQALAEEFAVRWPAPPDSPGLAGVMRTGEPMFAPTIDESTLSAWAQSPEHLEAMRGVGLVSSLSVPMRARHRVVGAMALVSTDATHHYDESDLAFAQQIADRIAIAFDNARLYREAREAKITAERLYEAEQRARAEAERAVRFSETFVGILGHDLRNPLSSITTAAMLVLHRNDSDERLSKPVGRILSSSHRMTRMIDQILDFTRIRVGRGIPLRRKRTDLTNVCHVVVEELKAGAPQLDVQVKVTGDPTGEWDDDRLAQLAQNLVGNAAQHRQAGTAVSIAIDGTAPETVRLCIENEGVIPAGILPNIFEPLHGGEHGKHKGSSGLGLGLYISQQIAVAHGGSIRVESDPERGRTEFVVELPRAFAQHAEHVFDASVGKEDAQ